MISLTDLCQRYSNHVTSAPIIAVHVNCVVPLTRPHYLLHYNIERVYDDNQ